MGCLLNYDVKMREEIERMRALNERAKSYRKDLSAQIIRLNKSVYELAIEVEDLQKELSAYSPSVLNVEDKKVIKEPLLKAYPMIKAPSPHFVEIGSPWKELHF